MNCIYVGCALVLYWVSIFLVISFSVYQDQPSQSYIISANKFYFSLKYLIFKRYQFLSYRFLDFVILGFIRVVYISRLDFIGQVEYITSELVFIKVLILIFVRIDYLFFFCYQRIVDIIFSIYIGRICSSYLGRLYSFFQDIPDSLLFFIFLIITINIVLIFHQI